MIILQEVFYVKSKKYISPNLKELWTGMPDGEKWEAKYYAADDKYRELINIVADAAPGELERIIKLIDQEQESRRAKGGLS